MTTSEIVEYIDNRIKELNPDNNSNNITDMGVGCVLAGI
jgi:hypothetical protein